MDFQFKTNRKGNDLTISMSGRLDTLSAADLAKEVKEINELPLQNVEVEISGLNYISSSGLRCFVSLLKSSRGQGGTFTIIGMQPAVREIFDLTGFSKIFGLK